MDKFSLENFVEESEQSSTRKTNIDIQLESFEMYSVQEAAEVTINIRMLKAGLIFAESCSLSVGLHFDKPGRPVILSIQENVDFSSVFVLATLYNDENLDTTRLRRNIIGISQETINSDELFKNCDLLCSDSSDDDIFK